jgi:hypothetical protein
MITGLISCVSVLIFLSWAVGGYYAMVQTDLVYGAFKKVGHNLGTALKLGRSANDGVYN